MAWLVRSERSSSPCYVLEDTNTDWVAIFCSSNRETRIVVLGVFSTSGVIVLNPFPHIRYSAELILSMRDVSFFYGSKSGAEVVSLVTDRVEEIGCVIAGSRLVDVQA